MHQENTLTYLTSDRSKFARSKLLQSKRYKVSFENIIPVEDPNNTKTGWEIEEEKRAPTSKPNKRRKPKEKSFKITPLAAVVAEEMRTAVAGADLIAQEDVDMDFVDEMGLVDEVGLVDEMVDANTKEFVKEQDDTIALQPGIEQGFSPSPEEASAFPPVVPEY